jgi:predicted N-formylglutamate amidohydrolase
MDWPRRAAAVRRDKSSRQVPGRALCDHASSYIPRRLGSLGLEPKDRLRHIAWDIGAADVARRLSSHLDAPLFLSSYSRLVVDCNRPLRVADMFAERSEDTVIPGNVGITAKEKADRASTFYWPYHDALHGFIEARFTSGAVPVVISVHSFTRSIAASPGAGMWASTIGWIRASPCSQSKACAAILN